MQLGHAIVLAKDYNQGNALLRIAVIGVTGVLSRKQH
jgi:hypothetical protein